MRGDDLQQEAMLSCLFPEARVPRNHPLRPIRKMVNQALAELFTVDGALIEAWASLKSLRPNDAPTSKGGGRNPEVDFYGEKRLNQTHASTTGPEARLFRKGKGKKPSFASWVMC